MRRFLLISSLSVILLVIVSFAWVAWQFFYTPLPINQPSITITVPPDITAAKLADNFHQQGILPNPRVFTLFARMQGSLKHIKVGQYRLVPGMTAAELLGKLIKGGVILNKITLVEGWTFKKMMSAIQANPHITHTLNKDATPEEIMASIHHPGEHPEGRFYPDTYFFTSGSKDLKILAMAYEVMQKRLQQAWQDRDPNVPYESPYQALIVASMVEKETASHRERPMIAGVILKRLSSKMRLQIDATVIYGLGDSYRAPLTGSNLRADTPYNTYTRSGLPPTPIAMPQEASIQAALHPADTNALYYVAKGDGSHIFSENLQAHHKAAVRYWSVMKQLEIKNKTQAGYALLTRLSVSGKLMFNYWSFISVE